ncbi:MAG: extracellular solute-binding protein [Spirochaetes bacterium]|nr:extracellular solute-binding protein [Spirochaetota bacterium]
MRWLFTGFLASLIAFSLFMSWRFSGAIGQGGAPVIYWVTDPNPARIEQIALFKSWLKKRGYQDIDLRLDVNNQGAQKTVVQGVTGVAGDCIDAGSTWIRYFYSMGIISPVTNLEKRFGYPDDGLFPCIRSDIFVDGKQIAFPCNLGIAGYLVNADVFKKYGMETPPFLMDFATFERLGKEFVEKANAGRRRETFFAGAISHEAMRRSLGVTHFNETLTRSAINRKEFVDVLNLMFKWTYTDHLVPTAAEMASFSVEQGYGGLQYQLLCKGNFGMVETGRWAMIQMRKMKNPVQWAQVLYPHGGYPNAMATTRAAVLYAGTKNRDAAVHFLAFLRSDDYNMHVVRDSDGIPPNPKFMDTDEFLKPAGKTNEWAMHASSRRIANDYAFPRDISPFALFQKYNRAESLAIQGFMNRLTTAEQAVALIEQGVNDELDRFMRTHPDLRSAFQAAQERQKKIDAAKAAGQKIPLALVDNPFLARYYKDKGLGE